MVPTCSVDVGGQPEFRSQLSRLGQRKHKCKPRQITKNCCYSSIPPHWISEYKLPPPPRYDGLRLKTANSFSSFKSICLIFQRRPHLSQAGGPPGRLACGHPCTLPAHHVKGSTCSAGLVGITTSHNGFFLSKQTRRAG